MTEEKPRSRSRSDFQENKIPLKEAYNPKGIIAARGKQPPPTENTNTQN